MMQDGSGIQSAGNPKLLYASLFTEHLGSLRLRDRVALGAERCDSEGSAFRKRTYARMSDL